MNINNFSFDPIQQRANLGFNEPTSNSFGSLGFPLKIEKHETVEQIEKAARHRSADLLEEVARKLREHHG